MRLVTGYSIIFGVALFARIVLSLLDFELATPEQRMAWSWGVFAIFLIAFAAAAILAERAHIPSPGETLRTRRALALAVTAGAIVALLTIGSDIVSPAAAARGVPTVHVTGIAAVPFYVYGAILLTVVFHFLPRAAATWLAIRLPAGWRRFVVSAAVLLVAFSEDFSFFARGPDLLTVEAGRHALSVLANATEATLIYRYGLLAGLLQRSTTYLLWHIVWPGIGPL